MAWDSGTSSSKRLISSRVVGNLQPEGASGRPLSHLFLPVFSYHHVTSIGPACHCRPVFLSYTSPSISVSVKQRLSFLGVILFTAEYLPTHVWLTWTKPAKVGLILINVRAGCPTQPSSGWVGCA